MCVVSVTIEDIVARCQAAVATQTPELAVRDVLKDLVSRPTTLEQALGTVRRGGITTLHNAADLTILHVAWTPGMAVNPHDHRMWAAIGIYGGQEDNSFYRRIPGGLVPSGGKELAAKDVLVLGDDVIHSVANSRREFAVALHVYGGDFFAAARSEWDFETYKESRRNLAATRKIFEDANARWLAEVC